MSNQLMTIPPEMIEDLIREKDQTLAALTPAWLNADPKHKAQLQTAMDALLDQRLELMAMRPKCGNIAENTCAGAPANAS